MRVPHLGMDIIVNSSAPRFLFPTLWGYIAPDSILEVPSSSSSIVVIVFIAAIVILMFIFIRSICGSYFSLAGSVCIMASHTKTSAESARLQKAIADVLPKIQQILQKCKYKAAGLIQPAVDEIKHMCIDADLAYTRPIFGRNCGIHPGSRAGAGLCAFNVQNLALKISFQGFSESKLLDKPMGFEPAGTETAESANRRNLQLEFNERTFAEASGYLRTIPHYDLMYLSVTCSHTLAALNIIEGGCRGLHK